MIYFKIRFYIIFSILVIFSACISLSKESDINSKYILSNKIDNRYVTNSENNKYLGYYYLDYLFYDKEKEDPPRERWIRGIYVYEKYVITEIFYGYHVVEYAVYKKDKNISYYEYDNQNEIYKTNEYYFWGIYDDYLFLLDMGNNPTFRELKIIDLNNKEIIFNGSYIWEKGLKLVEPNIFELYEYNNEVIEQQNIRSTNYRFIFDKYIFNIKTKEKIMIEQINIYSEW